MGPSVATQTIPQNAAASGERMFQANMFNPALLGGRGAGGGRRGHGLSRSLRGSETMLSILTLSVTPACLRLSVRARFTLSARRLSAAGGGALLLVKLRDHPPARSGPSSRNSRPLVFGP